MSGPKSSRYQLTPEQRKALEEARRREIARKKGLLILREHQKTLDKGVARLLAFVESASLLAKREGDDLSFLDRLKGFEEKFSSHRTMAELDPDTPFETVEEAVLKTKDLFAALGEEISELEALGGEVEVRLAESFSNAVSSAATESFADIDEKRSMTEKRIAMRRELLLAERDESLPRALRAEIRSALLALTDTKKLSDFEAVQLTPLRGKIAAAKAEKELYFEEYTALYAEYEALSAIVEEEALPVDCSPDGVKLLRRYIESLRYELSYDDEESYINDVLDTVMREMGYHVLATRTVDKKSGKRFSHELYTYHDGTVVNVTTASDGRITMELGKPDSVDRLPNENETDILVREMEAFCHDFAEIEERLRACGVVVADRITMLPPTVEHAQIINTAEYAFKKESEEEKRQAIAWQIRVNRRRKVFRHIKIQ